MKAEDSRGRIAIPERVRPYIEGWWRVWPISDKIGIPRNLCTFQETDPNRACGDGKALAK